MPQRDGGTRAGAGSANTTRNDGSSAPGAHAGKVPGEVIGGLVGGILASFGVRRDLPAVLDTVANTLASLGHRATVVSLRHGNLVVDCDARTASMLAWDEDVLTDTVNAPHPGAIETVTITVAGRRSRRS